MDALKRERYRKSTSIRHFEQCNQQLSNLICQNCDGSIKILLDVGNLQQEIPRAIVIQIKIRKPFSYDLVKNLMDMFMSPS